MKKLKYTTSYGTINPSCDFLKDFEQVDRIVDADFVIFPGGADVQPLYYGHSKHNTTIPFPTRDSEELKVFKYCLEHNKKMVGICRGAQFLCVMSGGLLIQDCTGHDSKTHDIINYKNEIINVNSYHHQMMYPYFLNQNEDYIILSYSKTKQSNHYVLDTDNNLDVHDEFVEIEDAYFKNIGALCIQSHPEIEYSMSKEANIYYKELLNDYLNDNLLDKYNQIKTNKNEKIYSI